MTKMNFKSLTSIFLVLSAVACTSTKQISHLYTSEGDMDLILPGKYVDDSTGNAVTSQVFRTMEEVNHDNLLMETETDNDGEPVIRDSIRTSRITARFTNAAERLGMIDLEFTIRASSDFVNGNSQLRLCPKLTYLQDTVYLDKVLFTSKAYRDWQNEGYARYEAYRSSIIRDSAQFVRTAMVVDFMSRNGKFMEQKEAEDHYVHWGSRIRNDKKMERENEMFIKYVPRPIETEGVRVDSVVDKVADKDLYYTYFYSLKTLPKMKKVNLYLEGEIYDTSENVFVIASPEPITYYVSSIATLARSLEYKGNPTAAARYAEGLEKLRDMEYEEAAEILRPYRDYNSALALIGNFKNYSALQILNSLKSDPDVEYLKAIVYSRLKRNDDALRCYMNACRGNKFYISRGNMDYDIQNLKANNNIDDNSLYE